MATSRSPSSSALPFLFLRLSSTGPWALRLLQTFHRALPGAGPARAALRPAHVQAAEGVKRRFLLLREFFLRDHGPVAAQTTSEAVFMPAPGTVLRPRLVGPAVGHEFVSPGLALNGVARACTNLAASRRFFPARGPEEQERGHGTPGSAQGQTVQRIILKRCLNRFSNCQNSPSIAGHISPSYSFGSASADSS